MVISRALVLVVAVNDKREEHSMTIPPSPNFITTVTEVEIKLPDDLTSNEVQHEPPYRPAIVIVTTTNGANTRSDERTRVLTSLCTGLNHEMMISEGFKLYLSVDAINPATAEALRYEFHSLCGGPQRPYYIPFTPTTTTTPDMSSFWIHPSDTTPGFPSSSTGRIAAHTGFVLRRSFDEFGHTHTLILEDDLEPAWDFIALFSHQHSPAIHALNHDPNVWCVSAWNDMGVHTHAKNMKRLFRTDFFPGLGWMTTQTMWQNVLRTIWPTHASTGWDNWMRSNNIHEYECIVPEVNRVRHIATSGTNVHDPGLAIYGAYAFSGLGGSNVPTAWELPGGSNSEEYAAYMESEMRGLPRISFSSLGMANTMLPVRGIVTYQANQIHNVLALFGVRIAMMDEARASWRGMITLRSPPPHETMLFLVNEARSVVAKQQAFEDLERGKFKLLAAQPGVNCDMTCATLGLKCSLTDLEHMTFPPGRGCMTMRRYFPCEGGCGHQTGLELPAFVSGQGGDTQGQCLMGESSFPTCRASHHMTSRLCACA